MILKRLEFKIGLAMVALLSSAEVVENIDLNGLEILNYEKVKPYLEIQVGQDINRDDIRSQIKTLYASGYFQQVSVSIEDGQLNIVLDEQPVIHDIEISSDGIPSDAVENGLKDAKIEKESY